MTDEPEILGSSVFLTFKETYSRVEGEKIQLD